MSFRTFIFILLLIMIPLTWIGYYALKYRNPFKLIMIFGKKGSGKSTFIAKTAYQIASSAVKRRKLVYSTIDLKIPGVRVFDVQDIGRYTFPHDSVVLIDEVGMIWDNRDYKNFRTDVRDWFKLQRHYRCTVYLFSQTFDIDIKLRNLTDEMYLLKSHFNFLSVCRKIARNITVINATAESESRIADNLEFVPLWTIPFGGKPLLFTFIPHWVSLFDSHETPPLPEISYRMYTNPLPEEFHHHYYGFHTFKFLYHSLIKLIAKIYVFVYKLFTNRS